MGYDYALVHLCYTIPPAVVLALLYRPLLTRLDAYKILFLIAIAVVATTPWDSYLIRNRVWTYPSHVVIGLALFRIPAEEVFFFVIQTFNTTLLYLIISKPTFHPAYLEGQKQELKGTKRIWKKLGQLIIFAGIVGGWGMVLRRDEGFYMGLILVWAGPFVLLLWTLAYQFILGLPISNTLLPIALSSAQLWIVDTLALKRGTWVIESGTKLGWHLWDGLEIEEAVFFLVTNVLIIFGLVAFDNAITILETFPSIFPDLPSLPSPVILIKALLTPISKYDESRIQGLREASDRLRQKSYSFSLASGAFEGRLKIDLVILYSFCRVADDLIDNAQTTAEAKLWVAHLTRYLDLSYGKQKLSEKTSISDFIIHSFPPSARTTLILLPTQYLSPTPFYDLLKGFEIDLKFSSPKDPFPIKDEAVLRTYGGRVAGTVAEACIELAYHHSRSTAPEDQMLRIVQAGGLMGTALQYVNIARDIAVDARQARVYLPTTWLKEMGLSPQDVIRDPAHPQIEVIRQRLIDRAMEIYVEARSAIEELPVTARGPMRVAVESYIEIGRTLRKPGYKLKAGRATVPRFQRIRVAWNALNQ